MKKYSLLTTLVLCCGFGLLPNPSYAQGRRTLTDAQLEAIVHPSLNNCSTDGFKPNSGRIDAASIIPIANAKAFPTDRVAKTLQGVWLGQVVGDTNDTVVDYFWIVDTKHNESLAIALRNGKQTVPNPRPTENTPKMTFLLCAHEGYVPSKETPMIHGFVKVSDTIADAPEILQKATGVKFTKAHPSLSDAWQEIVASGYFNNMPAIAFAGGMFKPMQIGAVPSALGGPAGISMGWDGEYRGGGATAIQYMTGVPIVGIEHGEFVGTTTSSGDYLVASPGNGVLWRVEADSSAVEASKGKGKEKEKVASKGYGNTGKVVASAYDMAFDAVSLGPLQ